jgi:hypothetical protein
MSYEHELMVLFCQSTLIIIAEQDAMYPEKKKKRASKQLVFLSLPANFFNSYQSKKFMTRNLIRMGFYSE